MQIHSKTDIGLKRHSNQDSVLTGSLDKDILFAIVCDGMGGAKAGNVASRIACEVISEYITRSYRAGMDSFDYEKMINNAIMSANLEIFDAASKDQELSGMGTTLVMAIIFKDRLIIAHVGDSRAYLANSELVQLTRDHSVVQTLVESGKITPNEAKVHPRKNIITRALGVEENVSADIGEFPFRENEVLLLCTDGLSGYAEADDIFKVLRSNTESPQEELINLANNGGGGDNITVVTVSN